MSNSEEHVEDYECPCYKCITFSVCQNKEIQVLMKDCRLLYTYLYKECASTPKNLCMDVINLHTLCKIMGIEIKKNYDNGNYDIKYRWQNEEKCNYTNK